MPTTPAFESFLAKEKWKRKLEKAGFSVDEEGYSHILAHPPGSNLNLMPTDRPPADGPSEENK